MISIWIILWILFTHWIADFVFQTDKMALGKSKNWNDLLLHTMSYSVITAIGMLLVYIPSSNPLVWFLFILITFIAHTITDYITSRENSKLAVLPSKHKFFVCIGFDQFLHFTQLLLTYYFLNKL